MADQKKWYFARKGKAYGPFTEHELCRHFEHGKFAASDFVFCKGEMEGWTKASDVPGLGDSLELSPEPEPEHHSVPFHEKASYEGSVDKRREKKRRKDREKKYWDKLPNGS